jgi:hypothetical protein
VHNDAFFISGPHGTIYHDRFQMAPITGQLPCGPATWFLPSYPNRWTQDGIFTFANENPLLPGQPGVVYQGGPILVAVDAAIIICPVTQQQEPDINVIPDSIYHSQATDVTITYVGDFTIYNNGTGNLNFGMANSLSWVTNGATPGIIPPGGYAPIDVIVNTSDIDTGTYVDTVTITSNDPDTPILKKPIIVIHVTWSANCSYIPGNVNGTGGFTGLDVVYAVAYLKGGPPPHYSCECTPGHVWYVEGDVNNSCTFTGLDVSYMVAFLKGGPALMPCDDCPPVLPATGSVPKEVKKETAH